MKLMGLDIGDRRIGIAVSDHTGLLATPVSVYQRVGTRRDVPALLRAAAEQQVEGFVVGMPFSQGGVEGAQAQRVSRFVEALSAQTPLPVLTWSERYTTTEADRLMIESGLSPEKRKAMRDAAAAAVILQSYLDSRRSAPEAAATPLGKR